MSNKKLLCDYKEELMNNGYSEELAENLAIMLESVVYTYGEEYEGVIYEALKSCRFIQAKSSIKDELIKTGTLSQQKENPQDLSSTSVVYMAMPKIAIQDGTYKLNGIDRVIVLGPRFNWDNPDSLGKLAREVDSLINNYKNAFEIHGNTLTTRRGLYESKEILTSDNNGIKRTIQSERGAGLERGLNNYMAQKIIRENFDSAYNILGLDYERLTAGNLTDHLDLDSIIKLARLTKDTTELRRVIDESIGYDTLLKELDKIYTLEQQRVKSVEDNDKLREISELLEKTFATSLAPKVSMLASSLGYSEDLSDTYQRAV